MNEELELIVQNMLNAGESEENIALVIQSYKSKKPEVVAEETASVAAETSAVEDTELVSEDISLDGQPEREYLIDNINVDKAELENKLNDIEFVKGVKNGSINIDIKNDKELEELARKQFNLTTESTEELTLIEKIPGIGKNQVTDFLGDLYRSAVQGYEQSKVVDPSLDLFYEGNEATDEEVLKFVEANKKIAEKDMQSDEMKDFNRVYEEAGGGWLGFVLGIAESPTTLPSMLVSSISSQISSALTSKQVLASATAGAGTGAAVGSLVGGIGAIPGALSGAMTGSMTAMETGLTFSELLQEEIEGDLTTEKVRKILDNPEKLQELKNRALGRGVAIGAVELATLGLAKGVGSKIAKAGFKGAPAAGATTAAGIEIVGGGTGEIAGRAVAGQEMDVAEIGFEAFAGLGSAPISMGKQVLNLKNNIDRVKINSQLKNTPYKNITEAFDPNTPVTESDINISRIKNSNKILNEQVDNKIKKAEITQEQGDNIKNNFRSTQNAANKISKLDLKKSDEVEVVSLLKEKESLNNKIKSVDEPSLTVLESDRVKEIDNRLKQISKADIEAKSKIEVEAATKKAVQAVKKAGIDLQVKELENSDAVAEFITKQDPNITESKAKEAGKQRGFIMPDGKTIIINKDVASKEGAVTTAAHEILHGVLFNTLNKGDESAFALANAIKMQLSNISTEDFKNSDLAARIEQYKADPDINEATKAEEVLTLFSEALATGDIKFNENVFTKIKDFVRRILQNAGFSKIDFNDSKDVYNFIKDYNKSVAKGKFTKAQVKAAKEGVAVGRRLKERVEDVAEKGVDETILKFSKQASDNVQKIYEDQGVAGALDIIEEFKPIVNKIVQRRSEAPNFDRQLLTDEIETGKRGLLELIQDYDVESGVPLAAYINKFLPARAIEASKRVLGETFEEDISQRVDIAAPEVEVEIKPKEEKVPRSLRKKLNIEKGSNLYNKVKDAVVKTFGTKLPEVTDPKFKKALSDSYKRELKKEVNALMGTRSDFKMFVTNNAETLYKSIPQETINKRFQAFSEPVLDKEGKQLREKTAVGKGIFKKKPFNKEEFVNYFLGEDVGASTKGTRKTALSETIADEMALDATMEVIEDPKVFEKFKEIQEIEGKKVPKDIKPKISEKVKRPEGFKFSASSINNASREFLRKKGVKEIKFNFENEEFTYDVNKGPLKNTDNTAVKYYQYITQEILPKYLPISNLVNSNNYASRSDKFGRGHFMTGKQRTSIVNKGLKNERKFTDRERKIVKETTSQKAFTTTKKGKKQLVNFGSKEYLQKTTNNYDGLEYILFQLQEMVKDYPGTSTYVAALFNSASGNSGHFIRQSAMPRGVDQGFIDAGFKGEKEHIWQQNQAAETMFDDILNSTVKKNFSFIKDNYFMLGISNTNNNKLKDLSGKYGEKYNYGNLPPSIFIDSLVEALKNNDFSKAMSIWIRYFNSNVNRNNGGMNPNSLTFDGKTVAELFNVGVEAKYRNNPDVITFQNSLIEDQIINELDPKAAKELLNEYLKLIPTKKKANKFSKSILNNSKVLDVEGNLNIQDLLSKAASIDEALKIARDINAPSKKIRVFDFDDTLAITKSDVLFTAPNGTKGKLNAEKFAIDGARLLEEGYVFDFSEFNKVTKGKPGPLLEVAKKIQAARGTEDVFVLTARAPEAQVAIKEFLDGVGLNIPLENITGLGNSTGEAKANWMIDKAAEGYNDFYFADDAYQNVKAVRDVMSVIDVKSKVQQAKFSLAKDLNSDFNKILENKTGIGAEKVYSDARAKTVGASKGKFKFFIPPSAEDFVGLLYPTLAKGKLGDQQMAWYKERLLNPFARAMENLSKDRVNLMSDFKALKKELDVPKDLRKEAIDGFTNEQAVRVYLWNKQGLDIKGISKRDLKDLTEVINKNPKLKVFADQLQAINKSEGYPAPQEFWLVGTITTDLINGLNTVKRAKHLKEWQTNADIIFSKENLNKLEAIYGANYREAMENILSRMKTGKNRLFSENRIANKVLDYINGSIGAIMFFNTRSAVLQTISSINFINWTDNNIYKAGKAFANQPQYWKDFITLMNSDFLKDRRQGLKLNISESEIADAAKTSKNKAKAAINYILQKGFLPTQIADSFAIASGGATFYRNKINSLIKQGVSKKEAEKQAFREFREIAEESQQSSRPDKISQQQASNVGRVILAFANTPSQYARIIKKAASDLKNKRGNWKNNISKIIYYGAMQNLIFNMLQQALFSIGFGYEDEDKKEKKYVGVANGMIDSLLRGLGYGGAAVAVGKNLLLDVYERSKRDRPEYVDAAWKLLDFSPPIDSKVSKLKAAGYMVDKYEKEMLYKGFALDNPAYEAASKVVSATTNIPLDRLFSKVNNISSAMAEDTETWQSVAMMLGWPEWQIKPTEKKEPESYILIK